MYVLLQFVHESEGHGAETHDAHGMQHFPTGARVIGTSRLSTKLVDVVDYVQELPNDQPIVFVVGAMAHGKVEAGYIDEEIAVSEYALSGSVVCGKVCYGFERRWNII